MSPADAGLDPVAFHYSLRGYDPVQVDAAVAAADRAYRSGYTAVRAAAAQELLAAEFRVVLRGYDRTEVDEYLRLISHQLQLDEQQRAAAGRVQVAFTRSLRGYDAEQVDALLEQVGAALVTRDAAQLTAARSAVRAGGFAVRWFYGYDREQVDQVLAQLDRELVAAT